MMIEPDKKYNSTCNCLAGLMAGDSLGLPYEGMGPARIKKLLKGNLKQNLLWGYGMVSDDSEHAFMTLLSVARSPCDANDFQKKLAWRLRWWLFRLPAGIGMATGRSIFKLWMGFPASKAGVHSAGNGPAMRAPLLGVLYSDKPALLKQYVHASTTLTHNDPKACLGALAAAVAARHHLLHRQADFTVFCEEFLALADDQPEEDIKAFTTLLSKVQDALNSAEGGQLLIKELGLEKGVTGFIYHTMPMVLYFAFSGRDFNTAIQQLVELGGDTDTTAAILGGILGAGFSHTPEYPPIMQALENILDWPVNPEKITVTSQLACRAIQTSKPEKALLWSFGPLVFVRNMVFLGIVLCHGFRRLLPPY